MSATNAKDDEASVRRRLMIAESDKFQAEVRKLMAESAKFDRERPLAPWLTVLGMAGAVVTVASLILRAFDVIH